MNTRPPPLRTTWAGLFSDHIAWCGLPQFLRSATLWHAIMTSQPIQADHTPVASSLNFEDLCLDPYQYQREGGRDEGTSAGLRAGWEDGRALGRQKALDVGIELGYMRGVAMVLRSKILVDLPSALSEDTGEKEVEASIVFSRRRAQKIEKSADDLIAAIAAFPTADDIFEEGQSDEGHSPDDGGNVGDSEFAPKSKNGPIDITDKIQRIRARFKLLCVQMKVTELSLTRVMDDAKERASAIAEGQGLQEEEKRLDPESASATAEGGADW